MYATGDKSEIGKIAESVSKIKRAQTPLQRGIGILAWLIFAVVMVIIVGILILGIMRNEPLLPMLILSAAVAVGAVPESLPIVLTVILAIGAERIASKKGIVKKLSAAETLGSATLIMTDKTGTLTLADMRLVGIHPIASLLSGSSPKEEKEFSHEQRKLLELTLSNVDVSIENPKAPEEKWSLKGRPFEVNIVKACQLEGIPLDGVVTGSSSLVLPFNSTNKFSVALRDADYVLLGAPDILLKRSNISKEEYLRLESWMEAVSREGKRLVGLLCLPKKRSIRKWVSRRKTRRA